MDKRWETGFLNLSPFKYVYLFDKKLIPQLYPLLFDPVFEFIL